MIDARYPIGKVETMDINSYSSEKFLKDMIETLTLLSSNDLGKLEDAIKEEIEKRQNQRFIDLQEKAINALKDYYEAGGSLCSSLENFYIDESKEYDDDFYHIHLK